MKKYTCPTLAAQQPELEPPRPALVYSEWFITNMVFQSNLARDPEGDLIPAGSVGISAVKYNREVGAVNPNRGPRLIESKSLAKMLSDFPALADAFDGLQEVIVHVLEATEAMDKLVQKDEESFKSALNSLADAYKSLKSDKLDTVLEACSFDDMDQALTHIGIPQQKEQVMPEEPVEPPEPAEDPEVTVVRNPRSRR